jgi:KUP system potassium uptake protein
MQQHIISLTVQFDPMPRVPEAERTKVDVVGAGFWHITVRFGFVEIPNIPGALSRIPPNECPFDKGDVVYFAAHDDVVRCPKSPRLPGWQRFLFAFMFRNSVRATDSFNLPAQDYLEVGRQIAL